jgi:hemolysin activation/secretion protein
VNVNEGAYVYADVGAVGTDSNAKPNSSVVAAVGVGVGLGVGAYDVVKNAT